MQLAHWLRSCEQISYNISQNIFTIFCENHCQHSNILILNRIILKIHIVNVLSSNCCPMISLIPPLSLIPCKIPRGLRGRAIPSRCSRKCLADGRWPAKGWQKGKDGRWSPGWQMIARSQHCERSVTRIPNDKSRPAWCWKTNPKNPQKVKGPGHGAQLVSDLSQKHSNQLQNFNFEITCVGFTEPRISIE